MCKPVVFFAALLLATAVAAPAARQAPSEREEFSATLSNISNVGASGLTPVTIRINRWTSDEENTRLLDVLREHGQGRFLDALLDGKAVGSISTPTSLKYDFFYARQSLDKDGGRRIMLISDRPMSVAERTSAATSREHPFTVIDFRLDKEGRGEGTMAQMVQLRLSGNFLAIDNLASSPMKLADIKKTR